MTAERAALRTFIVEDSAVIRDSLFAALQELAPVQVVGWADDEAGARQWLAQPPQPCDLVILDLWLREGSGLGVLRATQGHAARRVVLSNCATAEVRAQCLALGAERVFDKSGELDDLLRYCQQLGQALQPPPPDAERAPLGSR